MSNASKRKVPGPVSYLCTSNEPEDVIAAAGDVTRFLQLAARENSEDHEAFKQGLDWTLGIVCDALSYAGQLLANREEASRG